MSRKNTIITGASSGLGAEMARQFAALGRNLVITARRTDRLDQLKAELTGAYPGIKVLVKALDVNDHDAVFKVFGEAREELGSIDRVIVNAGLGKGQPVGTGNFHANKQTAETNFVAALAQCEAAVEIFREQRAGHLVVISSMSAMRGMRGNVTTYAATKAGVAALAEGIRSDLMRTKIKVSTIFPGYIRSEMNEKVKKTPLMVDTVPGVRSMVKAIERESTTACSPSWPWTAIGFAMRVLPLPVVRRIA
ncbi:SDR family oxidoreductase [Actinokineospora pegani]|uniref:SDR family oxidoreductase n=1 Tax=Actinokineospora pegani TaxID=2654637 RepID=UPI0012EA3B8C|nr:SDR family oxidoreductase [Actinokineospora pegani]